MAAFEDMLARYRAIVAAQSALEVKGKAMPYTALNGNMFTFLDKTGQLAMRLPDDARAAHEAVHGGGPVMQYGAIMKDYVALPHDATDDDIAALFRDSLAYAETLKPKPTKKGRSSAKDG